MSDRVYALTAFVRTRWLSGRLKSRDDIARYQAHKLEHMLRGVISRSAFYKRRGIASWDQVPVIDKQVLLDNFDGLNSPGITADQVRAALAQGSERIGKYAVGQSTGTSGNRGYYVISDRERFVWLGTILAKALPNALWSRHRVALALPGLPRLYQSASTGSRISIGFFDLGLGIDSWIERLEAFAPDTIVAPPKVLRHLAEHGRLSAQNIFSGAEVLDPLDRDVIETATGHKVREIYMATEGLFGVACRFGTLHLAEDAVAFEWQAVDGGTDLMTPLVTDFTRKVQVMARYRMNDLLELSSEPCPCGSPLQPIRRIEGRRDDIFLLQGSDGGRRILTPDVLRNAVIDADPQIKDFRIVQMGPSQIEVSLPDGLELAVDERVTKSLRQLTERAGIGKIDILVKRGVDLPFDRKLRRVRREWQEG